MFTKPKSLRDKKYIEWVKTLGCICCGRPNVDPHHENERGRAGKGVKAPDRRCIPICHEHHVERHCMGRDSFAEKYELDYEEIINGLNEYYVS